MRWLTFLARRFEWSSGETSEGGEAADEALVVFLQAEAHDEDDPQRPLRQLVKHVKWQARGRGLRTVVLHSFTHLGAAPSAPPEFADAWMADAAARLGVAGFRVLTTPFGTSCAWRLDVYGEPMAKVWKQV